MKKLFILALLTLACLVSTQGQTTNSTTNPTDRPTTVQTVVQPAPFMFDLLENNNGKCLVRYGNKTLTVTIENAPKTLFAEHRSFAREQQYVRFHTERLRQWDKRLRLAESQCASAASGDPAWVQAVMAQTQRVAAERAQYENQVSDLEAYMNRLEAEVDKDRKNEPFHHPRRCQGLFVTKGEWKIVRVY